MRAPRPSCAIFTLLCGRHTLELLVRVCARYLCSAAGDDDLVAKVLRVIGIWKQRDIVDVPMQNRLTGMLTG